MKRLQKNPLYAQVHQTLRNMIFNGELQLGQSIHEAHVAEALGISRTPVREAVKSLIAEGLLTVPAPGTIAVFAPSIDDIAEVYAARAALEGFSARLLAVAPPQPRFVQLLEQRAHCCAEAVERAGIREAIKHNAEFHKAIIDASRNSRISSLLDMMAPVVLRYSTVSANSHHQLVRSVAEHFDLVEALSVGDPDVVERVARDHVLRAGSRTISWIACIDSVSLDAGSPLSVLFERYREPETSNEELVVPGGSMRYAPS